MSQKFPVRDSYIGLEENVDGDPSAAVPVSQLQKFNFVSNINPTTTLSGSGIINSFWTNKNTRTLYYLESIDGGLYNWTPFSFGGSGGFGSCATLSSIYVNEPNHAVINPIPIFNWIWS